MTAPSEYFPVCRGSRKHIFVHTSIPALPLSRSMPLRRQDAAFAGSSPLCYGGSPTPKHVCDTIKANQKPKHVVAGSSFKAHGGLNSRASGR
jgi:hypothetical protein